MVWPWNRADISQAWKWPHIFWCNIVGWWSEEAPSEALRRWLSWYRIFICFYFTLFTAMLLIAIVEKFLQGDILDNMFTVFASCPGIVGILKMYCFILFRKSFKSVMDCISELFLDIRDSFEERLIRRTLKRVWLIFSFYLVMGFSISMNWSSRPIINAIFYGEKTRIVDTWPTFIDTWPQFFISFCYQIPVILGLGHAFYFFDNLYFCISECILCHFTILQYRLSNMRLAGTQDSSDYLTQCIQYYGKILRTCGLLRDSTSAVIIMQCIITVTMLCSGVFIVTMSEHTETMIMMNLGEKAFVVTTVLYFYCWYSNEITFQCQDVCNGAYMSDWTDGTEGNKKSLQILMSLTMKPVLFGGILNLNLNTFVTVLKATFSYYNFLIACVTINEGSDLTQ